MDFEKLINEAYESSMKGRKILSSLPNVDGIASRLIRLSVKVEALGPWYHFETYIDEDGRWIIQCWYEGREESADTYMVNGDAEAKKKVLSDIYAGVYADFKRIDPFAIDIDIVC